MCPCDGHKADWYEIKPEPLPKLTVEALAERGIEWPEWAKWRVVWPDGSLCMYQNEPELTEYGWRSTGGRWGGVPGTSNYRWDASDWEHSKIQRPEQWVPFTRETLPKLPFVVHDKKCSRNAITTVSAASDDFVWLSGANGETEYKELFEDFEMEDGSPCGVKK